MPPEDEILIGLRQLCASLEDWIPWTLILAEEARMGWGEGVALYCAECWEDLGITELVVDRAAGRFFPVTRVRLLRRVLDAFNPYPGVTALEFQLLPLYERAFHVHRLEKLHGVDDGLALDIPDWSRNFLLENEMSPASFADWWEKRRRWVEYFSDR